MNMKSAVSIDEKRIFEEYPVVGAVMRLALPTVAGQIIMVIYNMADTFFVGMAGNDAMLASVTVCMPAFMFLSAISNLFGIGGGSVIARAMGAGDKKDIPLASSFSFWGCLLSTVLYSVLSFVFLDWYVDILGGTSPLVHENAVSYLQTTVCLGGFAASMSVLMSHLIRSEGRAGLASAGIAMGGLLNIILDPIFMFKVLPPGNEALGAAMATSVSNLAALLFFLLLRLYLGKKSRLSFYPADAFGSYGVRRDIISTGLPACIMTLFENISYAVLDKLMSIQGISMQTGIGVAKKVNMLAHCIVRGIAQGSLPLIAYNYASGNHRRMLSSIKASRRIALITAAVCMAAYLVFAYPLIAIFIRHQSASLSYGADFLRILCIGGPFSASAYSFISFFQAVGEGKRSFFLAILRKGLVDIPLMFILGALFPIYGIVAATPLADALCCVCAEAMFRKYRLRYFY